VDFCGKVLEEFLYFVGFVLGITNEVGVPLFLVILPLKSHRKAFDFGVFVFLVCWSVLAVKYDTLRALVTNWFRLLFGLTHH
jgi:hypothetical protein